MFIAIVVNYGLECLTTEIKLEEIYLRARRQSFRAPLFIEKTCNCVSHYQLIVFSPLKNFLQIRLMRRNVAKFSMVGKKEKNFDSNCEIFFK